jgi:putative CocE/NonD family hydrolase
MKNPAQGGPQMFTRRRFLESAGIFAGAAVLDPRRFAPGRQSRKADPRLWAADAGRIRVSPGPWTTLPATVPGVRLENLYLRMPDGVRLNAFLYLPDKLPRGRKIPGLLETMPYRYGPLPDSYPARHGYASIFVDVRGTGGSEGIPTTEYSVEEYEDIAHVIDWLSKQPWANGRVGMSGGSYGAFNSVWTAAAVKPPALKAIFAMCGTDDRYTDDIHHPGGAMLMVDNSWALSMVTSNGMPGAPDYDLDSKASRDRWETPPWLQGFLHQQLDGPHYRRGSLAPGYERLTVPAFLAGGYLDVYQNFVPRIMRYSKNAVTKGILGPWHHSLTEPGPKIDLENAMMVRWFDHWLKDSDTGILEEPRVSFYMPRWRRQTFRYTGEVPGEWRHLDDWPETVFAPGERLFLRPDPEVPSDRALSMEPAPGRGGRLAGETGPASALKLRYYPGTGGNAQSFGPTRGEGYYGLDHRAEDVWGLAFDTPPLRESVEILGFAKARLFVSSTAPQANWIVRLCDVAPDGTSYLISRGILNGTHRRSHAKPEPLVPGEVTEIAVELMCVGYQFEPGHRIRVVVTNADFPVFWPSPYPMTTTLHTGGDRPSHIALPVLPKLTYREAELPMLPEEPSEAGPEEPAAKEESWLRISHDAENGVHSTVVNLPWAGKITCRVEDGDPAAASLRNVASNTEGDGGRRIEVRSDGELRSTADEFILDITCTLLENGREVRTRRWRDKVKRELV